MAIPPSERFDDLDADLRFEATEGSGPFASFSGPSSAGGNANYSYSVSKDDEVLNKQREAQRLREELERAEREAARLALIKQKEDRLRSGKAASLDHLKKATLIIDREMERLQSNYEELNTVREIFQSHIADINAIVPNSWSDEHQEERLDDAISKVEEAEETHAKAMRRINQIIGEKIEPKKSLLKESPEVSEFASYFRMGFAFTLPLILTLIIVIFLIKFLF